jgi:hypothetical protein
MRAVAVVSFGAVAFAIACTDTDIVLGDDTSPAEPERLTMPTDTSAESASEAGSPDAAPPVKDSGPDVSCGGPIAAKYSANGCVSGYACAPLACSAAGGACVGLSPGSCPSMHYGDATKYDCGGGLGVTCCLP